MHTIAYLTLAALLVLFAADNYQLTRKHERQQQALAQLAYHISEWHQQAMDERRAAIPSDAIRAQVAAERLLGTWEGR